MNDSFMVYVNCITYNQSAYIEDAMNGFCMQETSFPFVCGIIDDASTDGEPELIRQYFEKNFDLENDKIVCRSETDDFSLLFAQHKINTNCFFVAVFLKYNHYRKKSKEPYVSKWKDTAKYVAFCEGDDYWVDPLKLHKQVAFMEAHPGHSLCFCAHQLLLSTGEKKIDQRYPHDIEVCPMTDIIMGGGSYMSTNSMLYRNSLYIPYQTWAIGCPIGDLPTMLSLAHNGNVGYLSDVMCVYRYGAVNSWTSVMASSYRSRRNHYLAIKRMWWQFDKWSDHHYHNVIIKKIRNNRNGYYHELLLRLLHRI